MPAPTADAARHRQQAPPVLRHRFPAMGTAVSLIVPEEMGRSRLEELGAGVEAVFARENLRFSRFRPDSELSRVNASAGRRVAVSKTFLAVLLAALEAARATGGLFDPTILPALQDAGYDRDFDELLMAAREVLHPPRPCGTWADIDVDTARRAIRLPAGTALDFGGIAKGWTVDQAAALLAPRVPWAIVDAGGDLRLVGDAPPGGLEVAVEDPHDPRGEILRLRLREGALATTSVTRRAWGPGLHHVIDPRTSRPATTGILQATVWAATCARAEVGSKRALLAGRATLDTLPAVLVMEDGEIVTNLAAHDAGAAR